MVVASTVPLVVTVSGEPEQESTAVAPGSVNVLFCGTSIGLFPFIVMAGWQGSTSKIIAPISPSCVEAAGTEPVPYQRPLIVPPPLTVARPTNCSVLMLGLVIVPELTT